MSCPPLPVVAHCCCSEPREKVRVVPRLEYSCYPFSAWLPTGRGETWQAGPCGHLEELQEDWTGTRRLLDASPPTEPAHRAPPAPNSGHMQEGWSFFSQCRGLVPLAEPLKTWEGRARRCLPSKITLSSVPLL
uniref:Uncharacterized protein n=1 Tax=Molossus molossus TaxID=27622 RepID=A0A7J8HC39_MOLMO|nr:hypothetical protein HJG59_011193 [Molossus molossus]